VEIVEDQSSPSRIEPPHGNLTAQHRDDLEIDQLGRSEVLTAEALLVVAGGSPLEDGTCVRGDVLDLHARHGAILSPMAPMCSLQSLGLEGYAPASSACLSESSTGAVPIQAPKSASAKSLPSMVPTSLPFVATTVPVPGM